jgi:hypothetical protein
MHILNILLPEVSSSEISSLEVVTVFLEVNKIPSEAGCRRQG